MKISCDIVNDLMPLYHDGVASKDTKKLISEHLKECEECRKTFQKTTVKRRSMPQAENAPGFNAEAVPSFSEVSKKLKKQRYTIRSIIGAIIGLLFVYSVYKTVVDIVKKLKEQDI